MLRAEIVSRHFDLITGIWKPFLILRTLRNLEQGDAVLYSDSSRYAKGGYKNNLRKLADAIFAAGSKMGPMFPGIAGTCLPLTLKSEWANYMSHSICRHRQTSPSEQFAFSIASAGLCSTAEPQCISQFQDMFMQQASWLLLRKNRHTMKFLHHWLKLMHSQEFLFTAPMQDQDAMTLAALETHFPCAWFPPGHYVDYFTPQGKLMGKDLKGLDYIIDHLLPSVQVIMQKFSHRPSKMWKEEIKGTRYKSADQPKHMC